ncbi:Uncharacterised protein [Mycobacterium tuberculosis]|nr:Uncharacterised protein [Mycobacterium tuberculosis]
MALQDLQRCLARAVMFGQIVSGQQCQHGLTQFMGVAPVDGVGGPAAVRLPRFGQLLGREAGKRNGVHRRFLSYVAGHPASSSIPAAPNAIALTASKPM